MNFSVKNNRLKLSNSYDVSGSINTTSLLVGTDVGIDPSSTIDVSGSANITGNLSVDTNTLFVNASNNRVGVGTTTPSSTLDVAGGINATQFKTGGTATNTAGFTNSVYLESNVPSLTFSNTGTSLGKYTLGTTTGNFGIWNNNTNNYPLYINSSNNVGIGTITPQAKLDVATGNDGVSAIFSSANGPNNFNSIQLRGGTLGSSVNWQISKDKTLGSSLQIAPSTTSGGTLFGTPIFTIKNDGNVGIGNDNPVSKLVVGNSMGSGYGATIDSSGTQFGTVIRTYSVSPSTDNNALLWCRNINTTTSADTSIFRVNNNGNVGIGTNTPETKLDVVGNSIQCSNQGRFKGWYSGGAGSGLATEIGTLSSEGYINTYDRTAGTYGPLNLVAGSSANIKLLTNGNVGIGTTTPANRLDVRGVTRITNDDGNSMLYVNSVNPTGISATILNALTNFGGGYGELQTRGSIQTFYTTTDERMRIANSGNVGIGTTTPGSRLEVNGTTRALQLWGFNTTLSAVLGQFSSNGTAGWVFRNQGGGNGSVSFEGYLANDLKIFINPEGSSYINSGNVGIGTTTPAYPLDVSGSAKFTTIRDSANLTGTSGQVLSSTGGALSWITPSVSTGYAVLRERQNAGVNAGYNFSTSTLIKRRLNNVVSNGITISLSGTPDWNFTITEAGTYAFRGRACYSTAIAGTGYRDIFNSRIHIANETLTMDNAITGDTEKTNSFNVSAGGETLNGRNIWGNIDGILTITANTVLSMKQYSYPTLYPQFNGANNAGIANNVAGTEEVYAVLTIQKLA
jgi:hypothetical protein